MIDSERMKGEINLLTDKLRSFEEDLRLKVSELEQSTTEISHYREANSNLEMQISQLQS